MLAAAGLEVPDYFRITQARIHVERREWRPAIDILESVDVPDDLEASVHALLAGAYQCLGDVERAAGHLASLTEAGVAGMQSQGRRISITEGMREVSRIQKMCAAEAPNDV